MLQMLSGWLFNSSTLTPHGFCLLWEPSLIWSFVLGDAATGLAYFGIPIALARFVRRRSDLAFKPLFWLFVAFILFCGIAHWLELLTIWVPAYRLEAALKLCTALVSVVTMAALWRLLPQALALPSLAEMRAANEALKRREATLAQRRDELERLVVARTAALAESEARLRTATDNARVGLVIVGEDHRYRFANRAYAEILGVPDRDIVGLRVADVLATVYPTQIKPRLDQAFGGERVTYDLTKPASPDGPESVYAVTYEPGRSDGERVVVVVITGITERVQATRSLAESEVRFRATFEQAAVGMAHVGLDGRWLLVNQRLCAMLGYSEAELLVLTFQDITHPDDLKADLGNVHRLLAGEIETYSMEKRYVRKDGELLWIELTVSLVCGADGAGRHFISVIQDIATRKVAEAALAKNEARLRELLATLALGVFMARDLNGSIRYWSKGCKRLYGWAAEEAVGRMSHGLLSTRFPAPLAEIEAVLARDGEWRGDLVHRTRDGRELVVIAHKLLRRDVTGEPGVVLEAITDVTAQRRAEAALQQLNEELEGRVAEALAGRRLWAEVIEATDAFIQVIDAGYCFLAINRASAAEYERIFGLRPRVGDCMLDLLNGLPAERAAAKVLWDRALAGEAFTQVGEFGNEPLGRRWYEMKFSPLRDAEGRLLGAIHFSYDVTEQVQKQADLAVAQAQLHEMQKLETIGQLTGGVAHDFNNLLTAVIGSLRLLRKRLPAGDERAERLLGNAVQGAERGAALTQRLLAFGRRQVLKAEVVVLPALVRDMSELLRSSLGTGVQIALDLPDDLPPVIVDANQLELALLNLAVNARDAMDGEGWLTIAARAERRADEGEAPKLAPGRYVVLSVADTGEGMDAATLARAIEPFYTTKEVGKGTGLGLSMAHGLAAQSGGRLLLHSRPGEGTTVEIWLPQADGQDAQPAAPEPAPGRRCTVLVVDDDPLALGEHGGAVEGPRPRRRESQLGSADAGDPSRERTSRSSHHGPGHDGLAARGRAAPTAASASGAAGNQPR